MPRRKTIKEIKESVFEIHGDVVSLDEETYIDTKTKCRFIDKGYGEFFNTPNNVISKKQGHRKRSSEKRKKTCLKKYGKKTNLSINNYSKNRKYTLEEIQEKVESLGFTLLSEKYVNNAEKIEVRCPKCKVADFVYPRNFFHKKGTCATCYGNKKYTLKYVKRHLKEKGITLLSNVYKNNKEKLDVKCDICEHEWPATFDNMKNFNSGCPECAKDKRKETFMKNYGVDNPQKNSEIRNKTMETTKERYGQPYPLQNKEIMEKTINTNKERYGTDHPMKNHDIASKSMSSMNNSYTLQHWLSQEEIVCVGSYEKAVVEYLNQNRIDYLWQVQTFSLSNGQTYRPDLYLISEDKWVEIKGYFFKDAQEKWEMFKKEYGSDSELWDKDRLKELGII